MGMGMGMGTGTGTGIMGRPFGLSSDARRTGRRDARERRRRTLASRRTTAQEPNRRTCKRRYPFDQRLLRQIDASPSSVGIASVLI